MEIYIGLPVSLCLLLYSVLNNIFIGYTLIACWLLFALISLKQGYTTREIAAMSWRGGRQSFVVLKILILIGAAIGIWMASGVIPSLVYYCLKFITPLMPYAFVLAVFALCCLTSFLIGTAVGTVSTMGIPLMIIARSGHANLNVIAGAIMAGAYFGDRCSPMSSSAALVSNLTKTNIFTNIKNMLYSSIVPFCLSLVFYYALSLSQPVKTIGSGLSGNLSTTFTIGPIMLLPVIVILILSLCRVSINITISISILTAFALGMLFQNHQLAQEIHYLIFGFHINAPGPLQNIITGGGILSMLKTCLVVFASCSLAGVLEGINMFGGMKRVLLNMRLPRPELFGATAIVSVITAVFGCTQTIAVIMTREIMKDCYGSHDHLQLALDLENSGILISALIPWNIAALASTSIMNVSPAGFIPYAFYIYALPVIYFIYAKYSNEAKRGLN